MGEDRIEDLATDLFSHVFQTLDCEFGVESMDAGAVASAVEAAFVTKLRELYGTTKEEASKN